MFLNESNRPPLRRLSLTSIATAQIAASAVLTPADALLDIERLGSVDHIESPANADCSAAHGHLFCQVVRSLYAASVAHGFMVAGNNAPVIHLLPLGGQPDRCCGPSIWSAPVIPRAPPLA